MNAGLYYIWSKERGCWGNDMVFWRPHDCGYTSHIDEAGQYTAPQCEERCGKDDIAFPIELVDELSHRAIDIQKLKELKDKNRVAKANRAAHK